MSDSKDGTSSSIPVITDKDELLKYGLVRAAIPAEIDSQKWASELSQVTPLIMTAEDGEYSFYRNIMEEPGFPFDALLKESSEIGKAISEHFGIKTDEIRLDDAFCIHYNTSQDDTSGAKHMDPSDITVNM